MAKNTNLAGQPIICQLLSLLPREIVDRCVQEHRSDRYYKTMTAYKQLVFMVYGVVTKCPSLNLLCKNLLFLEDKLGYLGIDKLPAASTLSDANINRDSSVFASVYQKLYHHYRDVLDPLGHCLVGGEIDPGKVAVFDSSTVSLFVDVFRGAGRNPVNGKKKGGLKVHAKLPMGGFVPDLVCLSESAANDRRFLGQLGAGKGAIYLFDKGYANYQKWAEWSQKGACFVTRLNQNAKYEVLPGQPKEAIEYAGGGVVWDRRILLNPGQNALKARLVVYKDPQNGRVFSFVSNMFDCRPDTIALLYRHRWGIEVLFKRLKQNFGLAYFYSDNPEGIKTQVWAALIANLLFSVLHRQCGEREAYATIVSLAANNMGSYVSLVKIVKAGSLCQQERDLEIVQLDLFRIRQGGVFEFRGKSP